MMYKRHQLFCRVMTALMVCSHFWTVCIAPAQVADPVNANQEMMLQHVDAPVDLVLEQYADLTGRTLLKNPGVNATINLKSNGRLSTTEVLVAIESMLAMHNIALVPMGEKFLKVVQTGSVRQEGMKIQTDVPEEGLPETDELISQLVHLQYVGLEEVKNIVQSMLHGYGKIQTFERNNSMLITGTSANIKRVMEILAMLDRPVENRIETRIYEIKYADASEIAGKLNELVKQSQEEQKKQAPTPQVEPTPQVQTPAGVIRARRAAAAQQPATAEVSAQAELAERGIISGIVKIVADKRTNIIFVLSEPENFLFFDRIVTVLDRPVEPEISVQMVNLEFADADEISGILNGFIGAASSKDDVGGAASGSPAEGGDATSRAITEFVRERAARRENISDEAKTALGRLSSNTKILADKRTNSLLLMGRKSDLNALMTIINELDIMLAQVLVEAVIVEVTLSDNLSYGIDWLQRSMTVYNETVRGGGGGLNVRQPVAGFGGGFASASDVNFLDGSGLVDRNGIDLTGGALSYYLTLFDLNIDAIIKMAASSSDAKVLSTPVILTTDNTEASIVSGEERPIVTSTTTSGDTTAQTSQYEYRNIGIELDVTPRINPERFVVMDIKQTADNVGDLVEIDGNQVPVITKREMNASIGVEDRQTVVLGGLVQTAERKGRTKVPLLGDIPVLGALFRSDNRDQSKTELLVFITPYVLMSPEEARAETRRLHRSMNIDKRNWPKGWSDSRLFKTEEELKAMNTNAVDTHKVSIWTNPTPAQPAIEVVTDAPPVEAEPPAQEKTRSEPLMENTDAPEDIEPMAEPAGEPEEPTTAPAPEASVEPKLQDEWVTVKNGKNSTDEDAELLMLDDLLNQPVER